MTQEQVDKLISFGQMALEQGWYDKAREYFQQALALDASNEKLKRQVSKVGVLGLVPLPPKPAWDRLPSSGSSAVGFSKSFPENIEIGGNSFHIIFKTHNPSHEKHNQQSSP
jgi:hypothetical protein